MRVHHSISAGKNSLHLSILFVALVVLFGTACKQKSAATSQTGAEAPTGTVADNTFPEAEVLTPDTFLFYKRTPCFGMCAIFSMTVYANGDTEYSGKNFTNLIGDYRTKLDKTTLQNILKKAEDIDYFRMADVYDNQGVTDLPSIYTAIKKDNKLKWVKNRYNGPRELKALYEYLDKVIAEAKWETVN